MAEPRNPDRHRDPGVLARPSPELREQSKQVLGDAGWTMSDFLIACLAAVVRNPAGMLASLAKYRLDPKPRGRPRRDT
jgi:hypothetical protein